MTLALALAAWLVLPALPFLVLAAIRPSHHDPRRDDGADLLGVGVSRHVATRNTFNPEL